MCTSLHILNVVINLTENSMKNQHTSSVIMLVIGLSVSVLINLILIVCGILLCRYFFYPYSKHNYKMLLKE